MNCPYCGKRMNSGHIKAEGTAGLYFMPKYQEFGLFRTKKRIKKKGGVVLDGPYITRFNNVSAEAQQCDACNMIILSYSD